VAAPNKGGRPTNEAAISRAGEQAVLKVRKRLPELSDTLLKQAIDGKEQIKCPKCKHEFEVKWSGDPKVAQWLWERAEGKALEATKTDTADKLIQLFERMKDAGLAVAAARNAGALPPATVRDDGDDEDREGGQS